MHIKEDNELETTQLAQINEPRIHWDRLKSLQAKFTKSFKSSLSVKVYQQVSELLYTNTIHFICIKKSASMKEKKKCQWIRKYGIGLKPPYPALRKILKARIS